MGDRAVDDIDHGDANTEDTNLGGTTSLDTTEHRTQGRRRPQRIGEEIELYCNPFVEVYGRLSMWVRRLARRWLEKVARSPECWVGQQEEEQGGGEECQGELLGGGRFGGRGASRSVGSSCDF